MELTVPTARSVGSDRSYYYAGEAHGPDRPHYALLVPGYRRRKIGYGLV